MSRAKEVDAATIRLFWQAGMRNKNMLLLALLYPIGAIFMSTVTPLFIGKILASLTVPGADAMHYVPYFVASAIIGIIGNRYGFTVLLAHQAKTMSFLQQQALQIAEETEPGRVGRD